MTLFTVLLSMKVYFIELVWTRLGTYDFLGLRNVVRGTTVLLFYLDPDGFITRMWCMPFLQEQKTVTGADLFRHLEHENTGATLVYNNKRYNYFICCVSNEIISFAFLTGNYWLTLFLRYFFAISSVTIHVTMGDSNFLSVTILSYLILSYLLNKICRISVFLNLLVDCRLKVIYFYLKI